MTEQPKVLTRRQALLLGLGVPLLPLTSGCRATLPAGSSNSSDAAMSLLKTSAMAQGLPAFSELNDINVSYAGQWRWLVGKLQPALVDAGFRGGSEERILVHDGIIAQSHTGPQGHKQVVRVAAAGDGSAIKACFNAAEAHDRDRLDAAALVADAYALFLLGPMLLMNDNPHRDIQAALAGTAQIKPGERTQLCDVIRLTVSPGIGNSASDQLALYIDRTTHLMLRVRTTLNGLESTRGALVDIDTYEHRTMFGIKWPTAFHERLLRPAPVDVHRWRLTGLDVNRGETRAELSGPEFTGTASAKATPLAAD